MKSIDSDEITPAMIESGVAVLCAFDTTFEGEAAWAVRVYQAMRGARWHNEDD